MTRGVLDSIHGLGEALADSGGMAAETGVGRVDVVAAVDAERGVKGVKGVLALGESDRETSAGDVVARNRLCESWFLRRRFVSSREGMTRGARFLCGLG